MCYLGFLTVVSICKWVLAFLILQENKSKVGRSSLCKTTDKLRESIIAVTSFQLI